MVRLLVAPDSFKGSLSAQAAAAALAAGLRRAWPALQVDEQPLADGGEGTGAVWESLGARRVPCATEDIFGRPRAGYYLVRGDTALVEAAVGSGFLARQERPAGGEQASSRGTGRLLAAALTDPGVRRVLVALGGTGSSDGGRGLLEALGWRFEDAAGLAPPPGAAGLEHVARVQGRPLPKPVQGLYDVDCPLTGPSGALRLFGPQKGILPGRARRLDRAMEAYARRLAGAGAAPPPDPGQAGAGAAGGMGFALLALGGELLPGARTVAGWVDLDARIRAADGVVTGEGRIDGQSGHGKVVGLVASRAREAGRPVWAVTGSRGPGAEALYDLGLTGIYPLVPGPLPAGTAMARASRLLEEAAYHLGRWLRAAPGWIP